ncbi:MAG: hypothetical protein NTZ26_05350 [Candidatus Aminicenantes bacterium]|nr:hypothetical protein [Candidatus Aminicenantes bacterium]
MKISIRRSGGFAGPLLNKTLAVDTAAMPPAPARELEALLSAIPASALHGRRYHAKGGADILKYEVAMETPEGSVRFFFDESAVPEEFRPAWLVLEKMIDS